MVLLVYLSVCLSVRRITQIVMNGFAWNFDQICVLGLGEIDYTQSHIKSDQPGSHVFRWFLGQLSTDFHEIL